MDRIDEMKDYLTPIWNERFSEDQKKIEDYFNTHKKVISLEFKAIIHNIVSQVCSLQEVGEQCEITYLVISYLYSSLLNKGYQFEITLCNESLYIDKNSITTYWCPEFLYQYTVEEELYLQKELQKKYIRIKPYELESLRQDLFLQYWDIAKSYFQILVKQLKESAEFKKVKINGELRVLYGEHMGELKEFI